MAEKQLSVSDHNRKRIRQAISVPFIWEERPGMPKRNWKPGGALVNPVGGTLPIKLIASVPFQWEEEPGKPLPSFSHSSSEPPLLMLEWVARPDPPPDPPLLMLEWEEKLEKSLPSWGDDNFFHSDYEREELREPALEAWDIETDDDDDDSFSSAPSLLANRLVPTTALANAIPAEEAFMMDGHSSYFQAWEGRSFSPQAPSSPAWETDSSTSSYETGATSLVGAPFLECLFPLLTPNSSFPGNVRGHPERVFPNSSRKAKDYHHERNRSEAEGRNPLTLGELIMMSRRRSIHRKAVQMQEQNLSMEFMRKTTFGCCIKVGGLQEKWKRQLQLKLI